MQAGVSLFPLENELTSDCSCPDWSEVCKHTAASHYLLAEQFDEDPFLLMRLRGRNAETNYGSFAGKAQPRWF